MDLIKCKGCEKKIGEFDSSLIDRKILFTMSDKVVFEIKCKRCKILNIVRVKEFRRIGQKPDTEKVDQINLSDQ